MNPVNLILALILLVALAFAYLFYDGFTKRGAIPIGKAWRDFTSWAALVGIALADWLVSLLRWIADLWEPMQAQFGALFEQPSLAAFVQVMSFVFMALKLKAQSPLPRPNLPPIGAGQDGA